LKSAEASATSVEAATVRENFPPLDELFLSSVSRRITRQQRRSALDTDAPLRKVVRRDPPTDPADELGEEPDICID